MCLIPLQLQPIQDLRLAIAAGDASTLVHAFHGNRLDDLFRDHSADCFGTIDGEATLGTFTLSNPGSVCHDPPRYRSVGGCLRWFLLRLDRRVVIRCWSLTRALIAFLRLESSNLTTTESSSNGIQFHAWAAFPDGFRPRQPFRGLRRSLRLLSMLRRLRPKHILRPLSRAADWGNTSPASRLGWLQRAFAVLKCAIQRSNSAATFNALQRPLTVCMYE